MNNGAMSVLEYNDKELKKISDSIPEVFKRKPYSYAYGNNVKGKCKLAYVKAKRQ